MKKQVLGVKINDVSIPEVVDTVKEWLSKPGKYYIVTPNPEIVVMAQKDLELKKIINGADLAIPDGQGLKLASDIENNSPGIDVMEELIKRAEDWGSRVAFLGGAPGVAEKTAECLRRKYPKIRVVYADSGGVIDNSGRLLRGPASSVSLPTFGVGPASSFPSVAAATRREPLLAVTPRNLSHIDILFVAFGPPKQEKWIAKNLPQLPVKVAMAVGGSFDYLSGAVPRAPKWLRDLDLEWLFRLIIQPWRIKRQLALVKYLYLILTH